jgi:hypothetical protein
MGIDSSHYISPAFAKWLVEWTPVRFAMRYLRRRKKVDESPRKKWPVYLSRAELRGLISAGLDVGLTQIFVGSDMLNGAQGRVVGEAAAWNAREIGAPSDVSVACDGEWSDKRSLVADELAYLLGWGRGFRRVKYAGESAALYVGSNTGLTGEELYQLPVFHRYWKALSHVPFPYPRGYCMVQSREHVLLGDGPPIFDQAARRAWKDARGREHCPWSLVPKTAQNAELGPLFDLDLACYDGLRGRLRVIAGDPI